MLIQEPVQGQSKSPKNLDAQDYRRRPTRVVEIGPIGVGGTNPIRIQSMTTTPTMDTQATVDQVKRLVEAGCEIVRITAPTENDAKNLEKIKSSLLKAGLHVPLVVDIHFRPDAALLAADFVEKVRINPGNFADSKTFKIREYSDAQYQEELVRIEERFTPLVLKLKKLKKALRIGTNHGSLSDRILNRFGDTPLGMVESALEFLDVCEKNQYFDIIFSMKSSNPKIMIAAYRLLAQRLDQRKGDYPFHLGVTEAGGGEDGRIKSAAGIGSLLEDGIGDTIRVSLTEDPEFEIPVARELANRYSRVVPSSSKFSPSDFDVSIASRRESISTKSGPLEMGSSSPIRIINKIALDRVSANDVLSILEERVKKDTPPEILEIDYKEDDFVRDYSRFHSTLNAETKRVAMWVGFKEGQVPQAFDLPTDGFAYHCKDQLIEAELALIASSCRKGDVPLILWGRSASLITEILSRLKGATFPVMVGLEGPSATDHVYSFRRLVTWLQDNRWPLPILLSSGAEAGLVGGSVVLGSLLCDGVGDAICVNGGELNHANLDFAYNLLQATGHRITKTDFVSCPSCGRTLFDLQSTTERIKSKMGHLKGVKIAIMGCIVNGPGEMADADFGYVGGGPGKINLYVGKQCIEKGIPSEIADEKLISIVKAHGKWLDPA